MILDSKLQIISATAVDTTVGTNAEGDTIDLDTIGRDVNSSHNLALVIDVTTAFTSGGAATVAFQLVSDATSTLAADGTETLHAQSDTLAYTVLVDGFRTVLPFAGYQTAERYLGLQVVTAGATTTAGSISAYLVMDAENWKAYPDGSN